MTEYRGLDEEGRRWSRYVTMSTWLWRRKVMEGYNDESPQSAPRSLKFANEGRFFLLIFGDHAATWLIYVGHRGRSVVAILCDGIISHVIP